jgi:hypothetical protein
VHTGPVLNQRVKYESFWLFPGYITLGVYVCHTDINVAIFKHSMLSALYILGKTERVYCVTPYLKEKLSKLRSFDRH